MNFTPTSIEGLVLVQSEFAGDHRGSFGRLFCAREFAAQGLPTDFPQHSLSHSAQQGTLRGLHFQRPPHHEVKLVRCLQGAIYDVVVDLRADSPSYLQWFAIELTAESGLGLLIPKGCAHGFQSLVDNVQVLYLIQPEFAPASADGVRHDDPAFGVRWPLAVSVLSDKDANWSEWHSRDPNLFVNGGST